jgi:hypothetical protein
MHDLVPELLGKLFDLALAHCIGDMLELTDDVREEDVQFPSLHQARLTRVPIVFVVRVVLRDVIP